MPTAFRCQYAADAPGILVTWIVTQPASELTKTADFAPLVASTLPDSALPQLRAKPLNFKSFAGTRDHRFSLPVQFKRRRFESTRAHHSILHVRHFCCRQTQHSKFSFIPKSASGILSYPLP
jgi:hypothetical protein